MDKKIMHRKQSTAPEWDYNETKQNIFSIKEAWVCELAVFLYVLGARINEARRLRPKDVSFKPSASGKKRIVVALPTEKNPYRDVRYVPINHRQEPDYARVVWNWKKSSSPESFPFLDYSESWFRKRLRMWLDIHPHALRHLRVHHLDDASIPGLRSLSPRMFMDYFGWSEIATSSRYQSRTRSKDLMDRF